MVQVSEEGEYAVRQPTAHAVYENHRVRCFRQMLLGPLDTTEQLLNLGELMYQVRVCPMAKGSHCRQWITCSTTAVCAIREVSFNKQCHCHAEASFFVKPCSCHSCALPLSKTWLCCAAESCRLQPMWAGQ